MQNLLEELKNLLTQEPKYLVDGQLFKNKIVEDALKLEPSLLKLIAKNDNIKRHFFVDVEGMIVFDKVKFQEFVSNKNFLPDSYTAFKNKIGLNDGKTYLKNTNDVVLSWAYKDCILEGGMTKEEVKGNVPEIFYNTTLAPDEITRLLDQKVLTNFQLWDKESVKSGKAKKPSDITENDNLLIKGNNLLALYSLKKRYAGKVKLIYIDPPYNTGGDSFRYNDSFNHSSWLTFMSNRLSAAKELLNENGVFMVQCDDNEQAYLKILCDEVFGREKFAFSIVWRKKSGGGQDSEYIAKEHEYILCYAKNALELEHRQKPIEEKEFNRVINGRKAKLMKLEKWGTSAYRQDRPSLYYSIKDPNGVDYFPKAPDGKDGRWRVKPELLRDDKIYWEKRNEKHVPYEVTYYDELVGQTKRIKERSIFYDIGNTTEAAKELQNLFGQKVFSTPKPEKLINRLIEISTKENDIVLDFFSGSGTTPSVAHKMGRRWIAIEQMDYIKDLPEARLKKVIEGEQGGISKDVKWQGGGSFVYCELKEWNEDFLQKARKAKDSKELVKVYEEMKEQAFFRYDFDSKKFDSKAFSELEFADQQKALIDMLDKNHLYVNYSEIEDSRYNISDEEKELSAKFYGDK